MTGIQEEIDTKQSAITKAAVSLKTSKKKLDAAQKKIEKLEVDMTETEKVIEGMNDEFKRIEEVSICHIRICFVAPSVFDQ